MYSVFVPEFPVSGAKGMSFLPGTGRVRLGDAFSAFRKTIEGESVLLALAV